MKITDLWKESDKPTKSFELFPPRSEKAAERSKKTIDVLAKLKPDFASVTFGAGGSTREGSYQLLVNFSLSTCWIKICQVMQQRLTSNAIKTQLILIYCLNWMIQANCRLSSRNSGSLPKIGNKY